MIFTADRVELASAISRAGAGLPTRPPQPVYYGMLAETDLDSDMVHLTAGDGDMMFLSSVTCEPEVYGKVILPGKLFTDVIRNLGGDEVRVECTGTTALITCGRAKFTLPVADGKEYPELNPSPGSFGDLGPEFPAALKKVAPAASDDGAAVLTAICLTAEDGVLKMVATDHARLAYEEIPFTLAPAYQRGLLGPIVGVEPERIPASDILLPAKAAERFASHCGPRIWISWSEGLITLKSAMHDQDEQGRLTGHLRAITMTGRRLQGPYLPWKNVLAKEPEDYWDLDFEALIRAVKLAQLASEQDDKVVITFTGGEIAVTSGHIGSGCTEYVSCGYKGEISAFLLGARQILDGLAGCQDTAEVGFRKQLPHPAPQVPLFIRSGSFKYLMQPRREL